VQLGNPVCKLVHFSEWDGNAERPIREDNACDYNEYHHTNKSANLWPEIEEAIERHNLELEERQVAEGPHRCCCKTRRPNECESLSGEQLVKSAMSFRLGKPVCPKHLGYTSFWKAGHTTVPPQCTKERSGSEARRCCCKSGDAEGCKLLVGDQLARAINPFAQGKAVCPGARGYGVYYKRGH
jgi:hypothetical protein